MIGVGTALITPLGFAVLAASAPEGQLGQTMGAAEVGREIGDAGGPLLVGLIAAATLTGGLAALAVLLAIGAGITATASRDAPEDAGVP
jgi:MFS family permease